MMRSYWAVIIVQATIAQFLIDLTPIPALAKDEIPAPIQVPATAQVVHKIQAAGLQIYLCSVDDKDATRLQWRLKEPQADLFDQAGNKLGKHYAGPTWEAVDGSKVTGEVLARTDSPNPSSIPWLLLNAKSTSGNGIFTPIRYIQRLSTAGGSVPQSACQTVGQELRVPYTAQYWFYIDKR